MRYHGDPANKPRKDITHIRVDNSFFVYVEKDKTFIGRLTNIEEYFYKQKGIIIDVKKDITVIFLCSTVTNVERGFERKINQDAYREHHLCEFVSDEYRICILNEYENTSLNSIIFKLADSCQE